VHFLIRHKFIFWTLLIALTGSYTLIQTAYAKNNTPVRWYPPKVRVSTKAGFSNVILYGRTRSNIPILVDLSKAYTLKSEVKNKKWNKGIENPTFKSNDRGLFKITIELPKGLVQVPILFNKYLDTSGDPILLTFNVGETDVKLNVKISPRPVKNKIAQAPEVYPRSYFAGVALGYYNQTQTYTRADTEVPITGFQLMSSISMRDENWGANAAFKFAPVTTEKTIRGWNVVEDSASAFNLHTEALYRIVKSNRNFWFLGGLDYINLPLSTINSLLEVRLVEYSALRLRVGALFETYVNRWNFNASVSYLHPFYLSVSTGELEYEPGYTLQAEGQVTYQFSDQWAAGGLATYEMSKFDYDFSDTSTFTSSNKDTNEAQNIELSIIGYYSF
jgi:hypothetical protein